MNNCVDLIKEHFLNSNTINRFTSLVFQRKKYHLCIKHQIFSIVSIIWINKKVLKTKLSFALFWNTFSVSSIDKMFMPLRKSFETNEVIPIVFINYFFAAVETLKTLNIKKANKKNFHWGYYQHQQQYIGVTFCVKEKPRS